MTEALLIQYAMPSDDTQKYPAIQATDYQPKNLKAEISLGLSMESYDLLSESSQKIISSEVLECQFGDDSVGLYVIPSDVRWIILNMPSTFVYQKDTGKYRKLISGERLSGTKNVTAARVFLCALVGDKILTGDDGKPQVFGLTLKSSKTGLIKKKTPSPGDGTIYSLNMALCKHYKLKGWLTHLVSVSLFACPEKFSSSISGETSLGVMFKLGTGAKALHPDQQKSMYDLLQDDELKASFTDPFNIANSNNVIASVDQIVDNGTPSIDDIADLF